MSSRQTFLFSENTTSDVYKSAVDLVFKVDQLYVDNAPLRPYFYANKPVSSQDPNYNRGEAMAEFTLDDFDLIIIGNREHPSKYIDRRWYDAWLTDSFRNSSVLRDYLDAHRSWYTAELGSFRDRVGANGQIRPNNGPSF